ncbi:MAG: hypothetical protein F4Y62_10695 [Rhodospirillaceae bacterium]|nr:hypothetical protein [Rhodospirillaceae bacterium]MYK15399.1 hypothetical protein [Rhodospirillaceae bacterium]
MTDQAGSRYARRMQDIQLAVDLLGWVEAAFLIVGLVLGLFGALLFGRGYKRRIADLEQRAAVPAIHQTFDFSAGADARGIRDAMEAETARGLRETMRQLPQRPLGDGHTVARLPDGTNIVSMANGEYRLALPVRLEGIGHIEAGGSATLTVTKADTAEERWRASPGAGRPAAKLIAQASALEEARAIWDVYLSTPHRTDMAWTYWAFIGRREEGGRGGEIPDLTHALYEAGEDIDPTDDIMATVKRWREHD